MNVRKKGGKPAIHIKTILDGLNLSKNQKEFAEHYVYCGMNGLEAAKACYQVNYDPEKYSEDKRKWFEELAYRGIATENLNNKNVVAYIKALREQLNNQLNLDKFWVIDKLKSLASTGSESTQLKATELLGKTLSMFNEVQKVEVTDESAGELARQAFEKRKQMMKEQKLSIYKTGTDDSVIENEPIQT